MSDCKHPKTVRLGATVGGVQLVGCTTCNVVLVAWKEPHPGKAP